MTFSLQGSSAIVKALTQEGCLSPQALEGYGAGWEVWLDLSGTTSG